MQTAAPVGVLAQRLDMTLTHDRSADLSRIAAPSLIVGTRDDATVPSYQSEDLHKAIAGSRLVILEEGATTPTAGTGRSGTASSMRSCGTPKAAYSRG